MREDLISYYRLKATRLLEHIQHGFYPEEAIDLQCEAWVTDDPVPWCDRLKGTYKPLQIGEIWGRRWQSAWLHIHGTIPAEWRELPLTLIFDAQGEALLFDDNGDPLWNFCISSCFGNRYRKDRLDIPAPHTEKFEAYVEVTSSGLFGQEYISHDPPDTIEKYIENEGKLKILKLAKTDAPMQELKVKLGFLLSLDETDLPPYRRAQLLSTLSRAVDVFDGNPANAPQALEVLQSQFELPAAASALTATAVGHAHIDVAWLWPIRETIRKCARTFSSQILNLKRFPEYRFGASQAQNYAFVKENYPGLYEEIKKFIAAGRWEVQGGLWVEPDCMMVSGEAMVRQFVYGKKFFEDEFGVDPQNAWIPDSFGYAGSLPQIMKKSGCDVLATCTLHRMDTNPFPYTSFRWRGIDGTEVVAHDLPQGGYNCLMRPANLAAAQNNCRETDVLPEYLALFGIGDGGGGAAPQHIQRAMLAQNFEGLPKIKFGVAEDFFAKLRAAAPKLPVWNGNLYLERLRGCFTSQARTKRYNRKMEQALNAAEFFAVCAGFDTYPQAEFDRIWKIALTNQFHDILPGSGIGEVYVDSERTSQEVLDKCQQIIAEKAAAIFTEAPDSCAVANTLGVDYTGLVQLPAAWGNAAVTDENGNFIPCQLGADGRVSVALNVKKHSFTTLKKAAVPAPQIAINTARVLENDLVRYTFDDKGRMTGAFDKTANREYLPAGNFGNVLTVTTDRPVRNDAWDIATEYWTAVTKEAECTAISPVTAGAAGMSMEAEFKVLSSTVKMRISLGANSRRLDFACHADWNERRQMLRVNFHTGMLTAEARYETMYGWERHSQHDSTLQEKGHFEICCHRYLSLNAPGFHAALLNDCKYGSSALDGSMALALLRAPNFPDPNADAGEHDFTYSFIIGAGHDEMVREAYCLNREVHCFIGKSAGQVLAPAVLEGDNMILEVMKKAERSDDLILRCYETAGATATGKLRFNVPVTAVAACDLMEKNPVPAAINGAETAITLKPFEIATFAVKLAK